MRRGQEGVSLIGVVVSVVLILVVGGGAFYGILQFNSSQSGSVSRDRGARSNVDTSLIGSTLRMDMSGAKAARAASVGQNLDIALANGGCVSWRIGSGLNGSKELSRTSILEGQTPSDDASTVTDGVSDGNFASDSNSVSISLHFTAGHNFEDKISFNNGGNGGGCW